MSRLSPLSVVVLAVAAACSDTPTTMPHAGSASLAKNQVMATGSGRFANPGTSGSFQLAAHADPDGSNPRGNAGMSAVQDFFPDFNARGPVTCLAVAGNRAAIGFKIHVGDVEGVDLAGQGLILIVEDNGPPGHGVADGLTNTGFFPDGDNLPCAAFLAQPTSPIVSGNVVVK